MILITGATGNTGSFVAERLAATFGAGAVTALVRNGSDVDALDALGLHVHRCDLGDPGSYLEVVQAGDTFVGVSNLRHSDQMLPHLVAAGVSQAHCVTTTAVFSGYHSYGQLYREIEDRLRGATVPVSLLRPSMIYGNERDHNMHRLIAVLQRSPMYPVFGDGSSLMQPVHVEDLANGIAAAVERGVASEYNLAGPTALSYEEILREIIAALGRRVRLVHLSHGVAAGMVKILESIPGFPIRHEQVMRLAEDKAFDISAAARDLDYRPRSFATGIRQEIARLQAEPGPPVARS